MTYHYDQLGPERFQHFAQALLLVDNPGMQCLPVAQPDGGRDGFVSPLFDRAHELVVFQVKFVRDPASIRNPHKWLSDQMASEAPKVANLLPRGVKRYYLVTNLGGTSHLDTGSIDRLQAVLSESMPVPAMALWRDDLDRRLDKAPSTLKWSYPELLRGTDILEVLVDSDLGENRRRRIDVLRAFIAEQYDRDEEVRFKQVELQNDLLQLFIDVPAILGKGPGDRRRGYDAPVGRSSHLYEHMLVEFDDNRQRAIFLDENREPAGAAAILLDEYVQERYACTVIEGAPGQGKSTLAQFVCQVYRISLRGMSTAALTSAHTPKGMRLPIKVDLPEYAEWQSGKNPFAEEGDDDRVVRAASKSLESFVAAMIADISGGGDFSVADLHAVLRTSRAILVLDGLDEIAETRRRDAVIREINAATRRLTELSRAIQVVVTTRPSAYAGVSDFSPRLFHHLELTTLTPALITDYANRWTAAKRINAREASSIRKALQSRLTQPHVRDLATNPMQLAILLSVIHSRGTSLPDKRTALYDIYVALFVAREAEKTEEVREHAELLIDVHQYLAYTLQARAESGDNLGRVEFDEIMNILRSYLISEDRDAGLADAIFAGAQRVVFLVARVEGTFEFEVQPLREYFAGKYLYETSAYSPTGNERGGTMPDRFDALCRNQYWLNVTRFFAGSLSKGELPALVDRLEHLASDEDYQCISYPRYLSATLLADWVFSQHQKSLQAVVKIVLDGPGIRALVRSTTATRQEGVMLPSGAGRAELINGVFEAIESYQSTSDSFVALTSMLRANADREELLRYWSERFQKCETVDGTRKWFTVAYFLGLVATMPPDSVSDIALQCGDVQKVASYLVGAKHYDAIARDERHTQSIIDGVLDGRIILNHRSDGSDLEAALLPFGPFWHEVAINSSVSGKMTMDDVLSDVRGVWRLSDERELNRTRSLLDEGAVPFLSLVDELRSTRVETWRTSIEPWSKLVGAAQRMWGSARLAIVRTAIIASLAKDPLLDRQRSVALLDDSIDLCTRMRAARLRAGSVSWWRKQFDSVETVEQAILAVSAFFFSAGPTVMATLISNVGGVVDDLSSVEVQRVAQLQKPNIGYISHWSSRTRIDVAHLPVSLSPRCAALLGMVSPMKVQVGLRSRYLEGYAGSDRHVRDLLVDIAIHELADANEKIGERQWQALIDAVVIPNDRPPSLWRLNQRSRAVARSMPLELAQQIARSASLPDPILSIAEQACELHVFESCEPLAVIAEREAWFANL